MMVERDGAPFGLAAPVRVELVEGLSTAGLWSLRDGGHLIQLAADLSRSERGHVLFHELGHAIYFERVLREHGSGAYLAMQEHAPNALEQAGAAAGRRFKP